MDTTRLYAQLDEAELEIEAIKRGGVDLYKAINALVLAYANDYGCDASGTMEHIDDAISDLVNDAEGPAWRRKTRLEDEIGAIKDADLRLSAPVVL